MNTVYGSSKLPRLTASVTRNVSPCATWNPANPNRREYRQGGAAARLERAVETVLFGPKLWKP